MPVCWTNKENRGNCMVNIRPFKEEDNEALLNIEKLCPQGNEECALTYDRKPDITARYELYDNREIRVAEENDSPIGWIGWTAKSGKEINYVYVAEMMVHPDYSGKDIDIELIREAEKAAQEAKASHIYCYAYETDETFIKLLEKLGYIQEKEIHALGMSAYKKIILKEHMTLKE
ncbi:MAG: GNAT family N-acetyltransferase [Methanolobus sp.]